MNSPAVRVRSSFLKAIFPALAWLLVGCKSHVVEQTIERTYKIEATASIGIHNVDGSILVYGSDREEIFIEATKQAYSQSRLDKIDIVVSAQPDSVTIETKFPPRTRWSFSDRSGTVDYIIIIPQTATIKRLELGTGEVFIKDMRGGPVRAQLQTGLLDVQNCFCDIDLAIGVGALTTVFDWWEPKKFSVDTRIENAKSRFVFPGDACFHLIAEAETGNIESDFTEQEERTGENDVSKIDKVIGEMPNAEINIRAHEGNIEIAEENP